MYAIVSAGKKASSSSYINTSSSRTVRPHRQFVGHFLCTISDHNASKYTGYYLETVVILLPNSSLNQGFKADNRAMNGNLLQDFYNQVPGIKCL